MQIQEPIWAWNGTLSKRSSTAQAVIHHSASDPSTTAATIDSWHKNQGYAGIGYHYVIYADGTIVRGRPEWAVGAHAIGANQDGIGICLTGDFRYYEPASLQLSSLVWLVKDILERYGTLTIKRHSEVYATICPGPQFPWANFLSGLEEGNMQYPCTIKIKDKEFPGYLEGGTSYFAPGVSVRAVVEAIKPAVEWDEKNHVVEVK